MCSDERPNIPGSCQVLDEGQDVDELSITHIIIPGQDGHAIVDLVSKDLHSTHYLSVPPEPAEPKMKCRNNEELTTTPLSTAYSATPLESQASYMRNRQQQAHGRLLECGSCGPHSAFLSDSKS